MSKRIIYIIANAVLPIVVIAITISLFFIFKPQEITSLFWINLVYTIFLEAVFFCYLNFLQVKTKKISRPFFAIFGTYCLYYLVLGFVGMLVYSFISIPVSTLDTHKIYIAVLIALTVVWIIISVLTVQTDNNYRKTVEALKEQGQSPNFYNQKIALLASRYEKLCAKKGLKYETLSSNRTELDRLKGKISFLTPNVFRNETAVAQILALFDKCENLIDEIEKATGDHAVEAQKKMQQFVDNAVAELDMVKNLARG